MKDIVISIGSRNWPAILAAGMVSVLLAGCQSDPPEVFPGHTLRTERVREERRPYLVVAAKGAEDQEHFVWQMDVWEAVHVHERPIHQKMHVYANPDDVNREHYRYEPVPGEEMPGDVQVRIEKRHVGPLAEARVRCLGGTYTTSADGLLRVDAEAVLQPFDDPRRDAIQCRLQTRSHETVEQTITRQDMLTAMGIDGRRSPGARSDASGLELSLEAPETVPPGQRVPLTIKGTNNSRGAVYEVRARAFANHKWLDGKTFYLGTIQAGETRGFTRYVTVPPGAEAETLFAQVGVRHAEGPLKEKALRLILTVGATE